MAGPYALGIDIGGTKMLAGLVGENHQVSRLNRFPTRHGQGMENLRTLQDLLADREYRAAARIGISVPAVLDRDGSLLYDNDVGLEGISLAEVLSSPERPVEVYPDVECGAIAEARWGAGKSYDNVLYVTIGSGIAHTLVLNGQSYLGANGSAILSGYSMPSRCNDPECDGIHVESISSGPGIGHAYDGGRSAEIVFRRAQEGDVKALSVIDHAATHAGDMIANLIHIFDPQIIVFGGGLGSGSALYREKIVTVARSRLLLKHLQNVVFVSAAFGDLSCCIGAAERARQSTKGG